MVRDRLTIARPYSQGAVTTAAPETADDTHNSLVIPPGLYDVEVAASNFSGSPTGLTVTIKEQGYLLTDPTHATVGWGPLVDARSRVVSISGPPVLTKFRVFLRGVRITRWYDGMDPNTGATKPNAGVDVAPAGAGGSIGKCQVTFWPQGRAPGFNGLP